MFEWPAAACGESPDDFEPDGTAYSLMAHDGKLLTVEPNHGEVISVTTAGESRQLIDISAAEGHFVPTCIAARDHSLYVGNLNLFPIDPQWVRVLTSSDGDRDDDYNSPPGFGTHGFRIISSKAGFTTVVAVDGPDGRLYVSNCGAIPVGHRLDLRPDRSCGSISLRAGNRRSIIALRYDSRAIQGGLA